MKSFESLGIWFLPKDPETYVAGTISFSKEQGIKLVLSNAIQKADGIGELNYPLIHGVVSESPYGKFISLFDCFTTNIRFGMPGISVERIRANHGFAGDEHVDSVLTLFNAASVSFPTLGAWLKTSGLKVDVEGEDVVARWHRPTKYECHVAGATIQTTAGLKTERGGKGGSISLHETQAFMVKGFGEKSANEIDSTYAGPLSKLVTFASDRPSQLDLFRFYKGENKTAQFNRIYSPAGEGSTSESNRDDDLLFTAADVPGGFEQFMKLWFEFVRGHPNFCRVFFLSGYDKKGFVETRFLLLMQAVECLLYDETPKESDDLKPFEKVRQTSFADNVFSQRPFAGVLIPTAFQMAMPSLFSKLVDENWELIEDVVGTSKEQFLNVLFGTFNYVMNRGKHPDEVKGSNFFWLHQRLAAVVKICLLKLLQFSHDKIVSIIARNGEMRHLKSIAEPWNA